jgi:RNA polymerase sigma-70 factor (ECF subfamily)
VEEPDPTQLRAAAHGDVDAFTGLMRAWQEPVFRFLCHVVGDRTAAEDLTQDVFLRAHRNLGGFRHQSKFSTWLFAIARNAAFDHHRRSVRAERALRSMTLPDRAPAPDDAVALRIGLSSLPINARAALVAVEVLGLRYHEAAVVLGVPEGTVKSRVFHARRALATWLEQTEQERRADEL